MMVFGSFLKIPLQPRVEAVKPETQTAPLRPRDQRTRERPAFNPRGPRPGNINTHSPNKSHYFFNVFIWFLPDILHMSDTFL